MAKIRGYMSKNNHVAAGGSDIARLGARWASSRLPYARPLTYIQRPSSLARGDPQIALTAFAYLPAALVNVGTTCH